VLSQLAKASLQPNSITANLVVELFLDSESAVIQNKRLSVIDFSQALSSCQVALLKIPEEQSLLLF
jgi:hypothetical protein